MKYLKALGQIRPEVMADIQADLDTHPQLWNQHKLRTKFKDTPHQVDDIWVRYRAWSEYRPTKPERLSDNLTEPEKDDWLLDDVRRFVTEPHESVWYPAIDAFPALRYAIFDLMRELEAERLGGVLITRIPPGGSVKAHTDGGWHAGYYCKVALQIRSHPDQAFCFADGEYSCPAGTVYTFDNSQEHWVSNNSPVERITAIICMRAGRWTKGLAEPPGDLLWNAERIG